MNLVKTTKEEIQDLRDEEVRMFEYFGNLDERRMIIAKMPLASFSPSPNTSDSNSNSDDSDDIYAALVIDTESLNSYFAPCTYSKFMVCFRDWYIHDKLIQAAFAPIASFIDTDVTEFIMSGNAWDEMMGEEL